jgi:hypothetical protein
MAKSPTTTSPSRRAVLAGIAASPALAGPALALTAKSTASNEPAPIFAALAEHRRLDGMQFDMWERLQETEVWGQRETDLEAERCRICDAGEQAGWALTKIRPTTAGGAGALITYVRGDLNHGEWQSSACSNALEALAGMGNVALPVGPAVAAPARALSGPDPIFALIEQHREAHDVRERCDDGKELDAVNEAAWAIEQELARTRPTTLAGILAIMRYERELSDQPLKYGYDIFDFENREDEPPRLTIRTWLITIEQSIVAIAGEVVS